MVLLTLPPLALAQAPAPEWTFTADLGDAMILGLGSQDEPVVMGRVGLGGYASDLITINLPTTGPPPTWVTTTDLAEEDYAADFVVGADGDSYAAGTAGAHSKLDFFVIHFAADGDLHWQFFRPGKGDRDDYARTLALDSTRKTIYAAGEVFDTSSYSGLLVALEADSGTLQWEYSQPNSFFFDVVVDTEGNAYVAGMRDGRSLIAKVNRLGIEEWAHVGFEGWCYKLAMDGAGFLYGVGSWEILSPESSGSARYLISAVKLSPKGTEIWQWGYWNSSDDYATDLTLDNQGNLYLCGKSVGMEWQIGFIRRLNGLTGQPDWGQSFGDGGWPHDDVVRLALSSDRVVALGNSREDLKVYQLGQETGELDWTYTMARSRGFDLAFHSGAVYLCGSGQDGTLVQKLRNDLTSVGEHTTSIESVVRIAAPNPLQTGMEIKLMVPTLTERLKVGIFDVSGRRVRELIDGAAPSGVQRVVWDGKSTEGRSLTRGVYFLRAETPKGAATAKVVIPAR